ncbi:MAG TPA: single-stranded DNA-binding protein [Planctomycetes bacterium]|nr:single-stranded DNA-binding protein [Planctomycetota bacterium]HIL37662.1 single-stranded DNA-binding protein [Planctomycetota bacterium]
MLPMDPMCLVDELAAAVDELSFEPPVTCVYNPLVYARAPLARYFERMWSPRPPALLLGMNPGPWGMAQTGVPFGEVSSARDWLAVEAPVQPPKQQHPKRPIQGFDCQRHEVSGARLWAWAQDRFATPEDFAQRFFVWNWCPLAFLEESGRNRTPDKLPADERAALEEVCDASLVRMVEALHPSRVIGIGRVAESAARRALGNDGPPIGTILHPSPASPIANRGWAPQAEKQLQALGLLD